MARRKQRRKTKKIEIEFLLNKLPKIEKIIQKKKDDVFNKSRCGK